MSFQPPEPYRPPAEQPYGPPPGQPPPLGARPPYGPPPPPVGRPVHRVLLAALVGALVGALAGGGWYLVSRFDGGGRSAAGVGVTASPSRSTDTVIPTPVPRPTPAPTPTVETPVPTTPAGPLLVPVADPGGFTLLVPDGWQRRTRDTVVFYDSPDRLSLIEVYAMGTDPPYQQALATEETLVNNPGYRRIRLERTADGGAELEYSYDLAGAGVRHAVDHILVGPDGNAWAVLVAGPDQDWPSPLGDLLRSELATFCLAGSCP